MVEDKIQGSTAGVQEVQEASCTSEEATPEQKETVALRRAAHAGALPAELVIGSRSSRQALGRGGEVDEEAQGWDREAEDVVPDYVSCVWGSASKHGTSESDQKRIHDRVQREVFADRIGHSSRSTGEDVGETQQREDGKGRASIHSGSVKLRAILHQAGGRRQSARRPEGEGLFLHRAATGTDDQAQNSRMDCSESVEVAHGI